MAAVVARHARSGEQLDPVVRRLMARFQFKHASKNDHGFVDPIRPFENQSQVKQQRG